MIGGAAEALLAYLELSVALAVGFVVLHCVRGRAFALGWRIAAPVAARAGQALLILCLAAPLLVRALPSPGADEAVTTDPMTPLAPAAVPAATVSAGGTGSLTSGRQPLDRQGLNGS